MMKKIEEVFGREFASKLRKFSRSLYEPLSNEELARLEEEVKKNMDLDSMMMDWEDYNVLFARTWVKAREKIKPLDSGNYYIPFFWKDSLLNAFAPEELANKMQDDTLYLLVGRGLREREWQGRLSYNITLRDAIPYQLEEEIPVEAPVEAPPVEAPVKAPSAEVKVELEMQELVEKIMTISSLTKEEITSEFLRKIGVVDEKTSDDVLRDAISIAKARLMEKKKFEKSALERAVPGEIQIPKEKPVEKPKPRLSPETEMTINLVKIAMEILGPEGLTIQAIKELAKDQVRFAELTKIPEPLLRKFINKVKEGSI
jgi:hypothetical protein